MNLVCIRHPKHDCKTSPVLTCTTCCKMYIAAIKAKNEVPAKATEPWSPFSDRSDLLDRSEHTRNSLQKINRLMDELKAKSEEFKK